MNNPHGFTDAITLTKTDGRKFWIRVSSIREVLESDDGQAVLIGPYGSRHTIKESFSEVLKLMEDAK